MIKKKLVSKHHIIRALANDVIDKNLAIELLLDGILTKEEVITKVFKKANLSQVAMDEKTSFKSNLLLYSSGKIGINDLEIAVEKYQEEPIDFKNIGNDIVPYFKDNVNKISELLTHKVLDYTSSMEFLEMLQQGKIISDEQKKYLEKIMNDFRCNELYNESVNEEIHGNGKNPTPIKYRPGLTIDPNMRIQYLKSIGSVKKIKIRGKSFIIDEDEKTKKNSLDGYELFIIPDKKIAVLEKLYEVKTDTNGDMVYRKDKDGKLIPAINNATYILPIGMAKEFAEKRNKRELIKSPYVHRANHSLDWVENMQIKMRIINPEIEFEKENTEVWRDKIRQNYIKNKELRSLDS